MIINPYRYAGDTWADDMLASYRTLNPEQATWFDGAGAAVETELLSRLQPGGYLHTTFGPDGQNKSVCDFVYVWKTSGNITSRTITKSGAALRWDIDGTVTTQNDLPAHTLGVGAGVLTMSSTDGWSGLTVFQIHTNSFSGTAPLWDFPSVTTFYIHTNSFSGTAPPWDFPNVTQFYIFSNQFSGTAPPWDFPNVTDFRIDTNSFSGTAPLWDFPNVTLFWISGNSFSGTAPLWDFPNVTNFRIYANTFSGAVPLWDFPNVTNFRIYTNQFSGTAPLWDFPNVTQFYIFSNSFSGTAPLWDFPKVTDFRINSNSFTSFSAFLSGLHTNWASKVGTCSLQMQVNLATLSGTYADEDPPTTDKGYIYELVNDPESTLYPKYTITYDA